MLKKVNSQRRWDKGFRRIAYGLLEEIEKPSRRFKVREESIWIVGKEGDGGVGEGEDEDEEEGYEP